MRPSTARLRVRAVPGGLDLKAGQKLGDECASVADARLADVGGHAERQHGTGTVGERTERDRLGGEFTRRLVVVRDAYRELATVGQRGDGGVESPSPSALRLRAPVTSAPGSAAVTAAARVKGERPMPPG